VFAQQIREFVDCYSIIVPLQVRCLRSETGRVHTFLPPTALMGGQRQASSGS
jgi:hypothetical protein